jgi:guanylate kinase
MEKGKLFIISAPTGVGKTTLVKETLKRIKDSIDIDRVVTYTSRKPRDGEIDGVHYHFINPEKFIQNIQSKFFLETNIYHAKEYGSPSSLVDELELGKNLILIVDRQGTKSAIVTIPDAITIWISAPSLEVIKKRLVGRGSESEKKVQQRMAIAKEETEFEEKKPFYQYHLVNDVFEKAVEELIHIITSEVA